MPEKLRRDLDRELPRAEVDAELQEFRELASRLYDRGFDLGLEQGEVVIPKARDREVAVDLGKTHFRIGIVSDTHGGSKFEQLTALREFYRYAEEERGVDLFVHAGDLTQGSDKMHRDQYLGVHAHGADAQVAYVAQVYPRSEKPTYIIGGNHDDSFLADGGTNVVRQVALRREDLVYVGQDAAYLAIGGLRMYVQHPDGGGAYAKSYKPQKLSEALPLEKRVALHLIGHYHTWGIFRQQRTLVMMLPCFQSQYSWLARKGLNPDIGGIILDVWLDDDGYPARIVPETVLFAPTEDDYDARISNEVGRAWSSRGIVAPGK